MLVAALLLYAPVALLAIAATPNEAGALGIVAVDCDGPIGVLVLALPALAVYAMGLAASLRDVLQRRAWPSRITLALCTVVCVLLATSIAAALREQSRDAHRETCDAA